MGAWIETGYSDDIYDGPYGNINIGVVKGKVNSSELINVIARMDARYKKIDRSKLEVKCVKFYPGNIVDIGYAKLNSGPNGVSDVQILHAETVGKTRHASQMPRPINAKGSMFIAKKNSRVRLFPYAIFNEGATSSGAMTITADVGGKTVSGNSCIMEDYSELSGWEYGEQYLSDTWVTDAVTVDKDVKVTIKSLAFTPFALNITGTPKSLPIGGGIYAKISGSAIGVDQGKAYYNLDFSLSGTAIKYPAIYDIKLAYTGDASNLDLSPGSNLFSYFGVAEKYTFTGTEWGEELSFRIPVKDPRKSASLDLSKLTLNYSVNEKVVKVMPAKKLRAYGSEIYYTGRQGVFLSLKKEFKYVPTIEKSPAILTRGDGLFSNNPLLYCVAKRGSTMKLTFWSDGRAKKSGTISYTVTVNGKAYKTWKMKVKKGKYYYKERFLTFNFKIKGNVKLGVKTKFKAS
jgi:hypothetical protein